MHQSFAAVQFTISCPARGNTRRRFCGRPGTRLETRLEPVGPQHLCGRYQVYIPKHNY
ncbi:MAG: hypothetical protein ACRDBO_09860 [Lachnospiraceae bacterium]